MKSSAAQTKNGDNNEDSPRPRISLELSTELKSNRRSLTESEQHYRSLFDFNVDAVYSMDESGRFITANESCHALSGYTLEELIGTTFLRLIVPSELEEVVARFRLALKGSAQTYECQIVHKSGQIVNASVSNVPIRVDGIVVGIYGIAKNISEQKRAMRELAESEQQFRELIEQAADAIYLMDNECVILDVNTQGCSFLGYEKSEMVGRNVAEFIDAQDLDATPFDYLGMTQGKTSVKCRRMISKSGKLIPTESRAKMLPDGRVQAFVRDITERREAQEAIHRQTYCDILTGLPNRALFLDRLDQMFSVASSRGESFAVLILDVDRFKQINDTLGHAAGDELIRMVAARLGKMIRKEDTVSRIGGDEFTFIIANIGHSSFAARIARKIIDTFQDPFIIDEHELYVTASLGIGIYPFDGLDGRTVLKNADTAMYRAKEHGRNSYQLYTEDMNANAYERLVLDSHLRRAIENEEFRLYYQPQVSLADGRLVGVEALIRWKHPDLGLVFPDKFIPHAEETGLIDPVGDWVLRAACKQAAQWYNSGHPIRVAINLSARQLDQSWLCDTIDGALLEHNLPAEWLELEVTESNIIQHKDRAIESLEMLKMVGVKTAVDDFGTGYSSLSYLPRFPLDVLKIDRAFVTGLGRSDKSTAVVKALIDLAHALGMEVIAEGVETREQLHALRDLNCDVVQGYFFSQPVPIDQLEELRARSPFVI